MLRWIGLAIAAVCGLAGAAAAQSGSATLDAVRARGQLLCGTSGEITGFSFLDSKGEMKGLDADGCRAIAAATLGDATKVRFVPLTAQNRFTALQAGEVDVLIRNTGWSLTRESSLGLLFAAVNFWDGTSLIVKTASGVKHVTDLNGATICVRPGTTTELDLADWGRRTKISYTPVLIGGVSEIQDAFLSGRCDALHHRQLATGRVPLRPGAARGRAADPAGADRHGAVRLDGAQGRRQVVRRRAVDALRAGGGREFRRDAGQRGQLRRDHQPGYPPDAGAGRGTSARRSGWTTGGRMTRSSRSAITATCMTARSRPRAWRGGRTSCGPRAACSSRRRCADCSVSLWLITPPR